MKKRFLLALLVAGVSATLTGCGSSANELKFNLAYDNMSRTMTYNFSDPLTLPDKTTITSGNLKPVWRDLSNIMDIPFKDVTNQGQSAGDMMQIENATNFKNANIFGGNGIAEQLMNYGSQGKFVDLNDYMEDMPNFSEYLKDNPDVKSAITATDGGIYHIPYVSEIGEIARTYNMRTDWVVDLLDTNYNYDKTNYSNIGTYSAFYNSDNQRAATVYPIKDESVTKDGTQNIIDIQNALSTKTGSTLATALKNYIKESYPQYENPSELYVGEMAAYDIDELVALFRVVKANEKILSGNTGFSSTTVWPFFVRQSSYREDILRFATYFDGARMFGSDSYSSRWVLDNDGQIQYTYNTEETYNVLTYLSDMFAEGLIHTDSLDTSNSGNFRTALYGSDEIINAEFGFMSFDWIASSTADSLNESVEVVLPPVANVNGVWQYYIDNSRTIKPDGWSISVAGSSDAQIDKAIELFDYMFSEDGSRMQNYGMDSLLVDGATWESEYDGFTTTEEYPVFKDWVTEKADELAEGDLSVFLRDYIGALMPIGFAKEIGFEYQYTSDRGFEGLEMLNNSTLNIPNYEGTGTTGTNQNYYKLVPPTFAMSEALQVNALLYTPQEEFYELLFNVIRYESKNNAPSSVEMATSYAQYSAKFDEKNIDKYIETYQKAYEQMLLLQSK